MQQRNHPKIFGLIGAALGAVYIAFAVLGPNSSGQSASLQHQLVRLLWGVPFGAVFGALIGTGIGLLVGAIFRRR